MIRLLLISKVMPLPLDSGGRVRLWNMISRLARSADVRLLAFGEPTFAPQMRDAGVDIHVVSPPVRPLGASGVAFRALHSVGVPTEVAYWSSREMRQAVASAVQSWRPDIVQAEFYQMLPYLDNAGDRPRCVTAHDVGWVPVKRAAELSSGVRRAYREIQASTTRRYEIGTYNACDSVWTMSDTDVGVLRTAGVRTRCEVVPNGVDVDAFAFAVPTAESRHALFIGSAAHQPNVDALRFYVSLVHPRVLQRYPDYTLDVVGMTSREAGLIGVDDSGIRWHGKVPAVEPYYRQAALSIAPIRVGGGTRIKILESMALGVPVVSTSVGIEGIAAEAGEHFRLADEPDTFAEEVCRALDTPLVDIARRARALVEASYSWDSIAARQLNLYESVLADWGRSG